MQVIKKITLLIAFVCTVCANAGNHQPKTDDLDKVNEVVLPGLEESIENIDKTSTKEVKQLFLEVKRVKRLFRPKKRLSKVKYTIA